MVTNTYKVSYQKRSKYVKINIIWLFDLAIGQGLHLRIGYLHLHSYILTNISQNSKYY